MTEFGIERTEPDGHRSACKMCSRNKSRLPKNSLRKAIGESLKNYKFGGKTKHTEQYGIDMEAITGWLGAQPSIIHERDHIIPLFAFDYNDLMQIAASWHFSNLQWLTDEENRKKGIKYDEEELKQYLEWYKEYVWDAGLSSRVLAAFPELTKSA